MLIGVSCRKIFLFFNKKYIKFIYLSHFYAILKNDLFDIKEEKPCFPYVTL